LFEWDDKKNKANSAKHGLSFDKARALFDENEGISFDIRTSGEPRYMRIGIIDGKFWSCIYTMRGENIRLISCRRSRPKEEATYHDKN
jgi:uncharacterized protein